jgi:4-amino-4-deoxy-L-arabinose transferase-like glycosyltransferase
VRIAWIVVAATTLARLVVAATLPLSGDEAYYWEWSRRLAFGYVDHPPMVAWLIALFTFAAKSAFLVRLPFVLCGLGAAVALFAFATRATGDRRAGAAAALLLSLAPFAIIAFTMASPDGAELFFWSLSLYFALRTLDVREPVWRLPLALALAATFLSSVLGAFLVVGIIFVLALGALSAPTSELNAHAAKYTAAAAVLFALCIAPYLFWDGSHGWHAMRFAVFGRHTFIPGGNFLIFIALLAAVLTPGVFIAAFPAMARLIRGREFPERLLLATSAPLLAVCIALSLREKVEFNWTDGALCTLIAALGLYAGVLFNRFTLAAVAAQAAALAALLFVIAALPMQSLRFAGDVFGLHLRNQGAFEIYAFEPAAHDVAREARATGSMVMTDGYGLSSVLDFYAGIPPVVIGYDAQGREARSWLQGAVSSRAIFFDKEPLASRPDFKLQLARACAAVKDDGTRTYIRDGQVTRTFYLTRCEGLTPARFALLLFPNKSNP